MLDRFDIAILNVTQMDDFQTADALADKVSLSPSAIARRLRRLRADGWIERTIAVLSARITDQQLRALIFIQLKEHADIASKSQLVGALSAAEQIEFVWKSAAASI